MCVARVPGYEGENCQTDIDECAAEPCENGGECLQLSDEGNYGLVGQLDREFSYAQAAGYLCQCTPGFIGENDVVSQTSKQYSVTRSNSITDITYIVFPCYLSTIIQRNILDYKENIYLLPPALSLFLPVLTYYRNNL